MAAKTPRTLVQEHIRACPVSSLGVGGVDSVEGVSRGCRLTPVSTVSTVSRVCRESVEGVEPGLNSVADEEVVGAADGYGMTMAFSGLRLFHH